MNTASTTKIAVMSFNLKPGQLFKYEGERNWRTVVSIEVPEKENGVAFGKHQRVRITTKSGDVCTPYWFCTMDVKING